MNNMMDMLKTAEMLRKMDDVLIITHRRPDGDAIGCGTALCHCLKKLGKTAWVLENPDITERYMPYFEGIVAPADFQPENVVTVDSASIGMLCDGAEKYLGHIDLAIDHHGSHEKYAEYVWVDASAAACGEMVLSIVEELCGQIPEECAEPLYLAISTDTGCFQYSNTSANTLMAAAKLKAAGVDTYSVNKIMFGTKSMARLKLESMLVAGMEMYAGGKVCVMTLTQQMMTDTGATDNDIDDIAGFPRVVEGVDIGIMIRELAGGKSKCSLRSAGKANSSDICAELGGGGHPGAAGVSWNGHYSELKKLMLEAVAKHGFEL